MVEGRSRLGRERQSVQLAHQLVPLEVLFLVRCNSQMETILKLIVHGK